MKLDWMLPWTKTFDIFVFNCCFFFPVLFAFYLCLLVKSQHHFSLNQMQSLHFVDFPRHHGRGLEEERDLRAYSPKDADTVLICCSQEHFWQLIWLSFLSPFFALLCHLCKTVSSSTMSHGSRAICRDAASQPLTPFSLFWGRSFPWSGFLSVLPLFIFISCSPVKILWHLIVSVASLAKALLDNTDLWVMVVEASTKGGWLQNFH